MDAKFRIKKKLLAPQISIIFNNKIKQYHLTNIDSAGAYLLLVPLTEKVSALAKLSRSSKGASKNEVGSHNKKVSEVESHAREMLDSAMKKWDMGQVLLENHE